MKKVAICVFGVNGVGKTALLQAISDMLPDVIVARGSTILKEALGVALYETLELMPMAEKKKVLIAGMSSLIQSSSNRLVIMDTHLVVPIRRFAAMTLEDMWEDEMLQIFQGFVYITANPLMVSERRRMSSERTLRAMRATLQMCVEDIRLNAERWDEICKRMPNKKVIVNDQSLLVGAEKIVVFIRSLFQ